MDGLRTSPLDDRHRSLGARMVPFGGWDMPVNYPAGTIEEHMACRRDAVVFDVSHLGTVRVEGPDAVARLQATLTADLTRIGPGRTQYTHLLDPVDASVSDDIIVWWVDDETLDVMPNASNTDGVCSAIGGRDVTTERAVLAVQGPRALERLAAVFPAAAEVERRTVRRLSWGTHACTVAGTGYTGEEGVEIAVERGGAGELWDALLAAGIAPAGLGARDTLRLEAGLPLHGHELGPGITSLQAGLGWAVSWTKPGFRGKDVLAVERAAGPHRVLRGIATEGRRPPRTDCPVLLDGAVVGEVTSGNFSPVLGHGIALAFVPPHVAVGDTVQIDVRGALLDGRVVELPFVRPGSSA